MAILLDGTLGITTPGLTNTGTETLVNLTSTGNTTLGDATTDTLTVGVTGIVKDASGNVGIGTSDTSNQRLKVKQSADTGAASFSFKVEANANDTGLYIGYRGVGAASAADTCAISATYSSTGAFKPITFLTSDAERMRIDSSGNVGIGTSSPATPLNVVSNSGAVGVQINGRSSDSIGVLKFTNNAGSTETARLQVDTTPNLIFCTGNAVTERMRIDSSGNLLVTTTSQINPGSGTQAGINLNAIGQIVGSVNSDTNYFRRTGTDGNLMVFYKVNSAVGGISVTASATAYATSSDYRLKENIMPMTGGLAKVSALKPVIYTWKSNQSEGQGFIAHELAEVVPQCVIGEKDAVDADGNPQYQGIDTSFLVATLTAAIQEQQALIQSLTTRITALETK
jgi:hypothetical protein